MLRDTLIVVRNSKRIIPLIVIMITIGQGGQALLQAWQPDPYPDYQIFMVPFLQHCDPLKVPQRDGYTLLSDNVTAIHNGIYKNTRDPLKWWMDCASYQWLDHSKILPILFNIGIIPLTYLLSTALTKDRIIGFLAVTTLLANPLYTQWITSMTYDQEWAFFLLLSVWLMYRFKALAYPSLLFSVLAKGLSIMYLPAWLYSLFKSDMKRNEKIAIIGLIGIAIAGTMLLLHGKIESMVGASIGFFPDHAGDALTRNFSMLWDEMPYLMAFVGINVTFHAKNKPMNKKVAAFWMLNALATTPLTYLFTDQFMFVYRFVPLAVFMSIYIGMVIVESCNWFMESRMNQQPKRPWKQMLKEAYLGKDK